jgi:hypothetical protein
MTSPDWAKNQEWASNDDALLEELKSAVSESANIPERLTSDAKAAFAWRTIDQELERLTLESDSLFDEPALTRGSGDDVARVLLFEANGIGMEIEIRDQVIVGQVFPMTGALITIVGASGPSVETRTDELGSFVADRATDGPIRIRCDTQDSSFITEWLAT